MSILPDTWIKKMAKEHQLISPFENSLVKESSGNRIISAGLSSFGYDIRLAIDGFKLFCSNGDTEIDPKAFSPDIVETPVLHTSKDHSQYYLIPPHSYALGLSLETFSIPRQVTGIAYGKSTYTRSGLLVNTTPLEAGWKGRLVIALANLTNYPHRVYVNEGISQVIFLSSPEACETSYEDRGGKYQHQQNITYAQV
jgi:dCTP deaminase